MKRAINKIPRFIKNIYFITFLLFLVWMVFFDQSDLILQAKLREELQQLRDDRNYYLTEIARTREELDKLMSDNKKLERFAREKYLMKKDNEDIFVIVRPLH